MLLEHGWHAAIMIVIQVLSSFLIRVAICGGFIGMRPGESPKSLHIRKSPLFKKNLGKWMERRHLRHLCSFQLGTIWLSADSIPLVQQLSHPIGFLWRLG